MRNLSEYFGKYLFKKILFNTCFGKIADPEPVTLSKNWAPLQVYFKQFARI